MHFYAYSDKFYRTGNDHQETDKRAHKRRIEQRRRVLEVKFASTRNVDVTAGLIRAGVQTERHEQRANIGRRVDVRTTVVVGGVGIEEVRREVLINVNAMGSNVDVGQRRHPGLCREFRALSHQKLGSRSNGSAGNDVRRRGGADSVRDEVHQKITRSQSRTGVREVLAIDDQARSGRDGNRSMSGTSSRERGTRDTKSLTGNESRKVVNLVRLEAAQRVGVVRVDRVLVPDIEVLAQKRSVAGGEVVAVLQTNEQVLHRPLQLLEQELLVGSADCEELLTMHADQGETDALDVNLVRLYLPITLSDLLLSFVVIG